MAHALATAVRPLLVLPIPDSAPPPLQHGDLERPTRSAFVQGLLAVQFGPGPDDSGYGPQPTSTRDLPEPHAWVSQMAQALVEVMAGNRPLQQVSRWTSPEVYASVSRRAALSTRRDVRRRRSALVLRVRVCEPVDGVIEACAVVVEGDRVRALAMRLSGIDRRWVVTVLQMG